MSTDATPRATTLRFQKLANRVVRGLLRVPGLASLIGRRLIEIEVVGRTSGRRFAVPVAYTAQATASWSAPRSPGVATCAAASR